MILSDYHVHTNYTDGNNSPEEMLLRAVELGMDTIGFSEHGYVSFDPDCRLGVEQTVIYRNEISRLKEKYSDRIKILCGIEIDYDADIDPVSGFIEDPLAYDYAIGSVHYMELKGERYSIDITPEETRLCIDRLFGGDCDSYAEAYYEKVAGLSEKWPVNIVGHFDLITKFQDCGVEMNTSGRRYRLAWEDAMKALCGECTFEINVGAMSRGYRKTPYPEMTMLQRLKALGGRAVISGDCHHAEALLKGFDEAEALAGAAGFTELGFTDQAGVFNRQK